MRTAVIAFVLCLVAATAGACVNSATAPVAAATKAAPTDRPPAELIKTAGAVTHQGSPSMQAGPSRQQAADDERPHHTGTAMLLAALAVMSGIALRRYGANDE